MAGSDKPSQPLDDLGRRIKAAREAETQSQPATPSSSALGVAFRLSTELVAAVFVGLFMGLGFDWLLGTRPLGLLLFLALGIAAGFYNVIRAARRLNAQQQRPEE